MPAKRNSTETGTADRILDIAERLVQVRGFNGFSYADVAAELGMTKASLHYHFPGKAELGRALIVRYTERFAAALDIDGASPTRPRSSTPTPGSTPTSCAAGACACAACSPPSTRRCPTRCAPR